MVIFKMADIHEQQIKIKTFRPTVTTGLSPRRRNRRPMFHRSWWFASWTSFTRSNGRWRVCFSDVLSSTEEQISRQWISQFFHQRTNDFVIFWHVNIVVDWHPTVFKTEKHFSEKYLSCLTHVLMLTRCLWTWVILKIEKYTRLVHVECAR